MGESHSDFHEISETSFYEPRCRVFIKKGDTDTCQGCTLPRSAHKIESDASKWVADDCTELEPCTTYGQILFKSRRRPVPFIRVSTKASATDISRLLLGWIQSNRYYTADYPELIISVTGGGQDFNVDARLKEEVTSGILRAAVQGRGWLFTGGTDAGVMKLVGEAKARYGKNVALFGVCTWGILDGIDAIEGCEGARIHYAKKAGVGLDPNHTHFVMVDDGTRKQFGKEMELRANVEKCLRTIDAELLGRTFPVPIVCVVLSGGVGTLQTAYESICAGTPVITVRGSGGAAKLFADLWDHFHGPDSPHGHAMCPVLADASLSCPDVSELRAAYEETVRFKVPDGKWRYAIETARYPDRLFLYESGEDFEDMFVTAILQGSRYSREDPVFATFLRKTEHPEEDEHNPNLIKFNVQQKLEIAITWGSFSVAKDLALPDMLRMQKEKEKAQLVSSWLVDALVYAMGHNRFRFVELMLYNDVKLPSDVMGRLYDDRFLPKFLATMLNAEREHAKGRRTLVAAASNKIHPQDDVKTHVKVMSLLQRLLGKDFTMPRGPPGAASSSLLADSENNNLRQSRHINPERIAEGTRRGGIAEAGDDFDENDDALFWAVLCNRMELAELFWWRTRLPLRKAIVACGLLRACVRHPEVPEETKRSMLANAVRFEELARSIVDLCYEQDQDKTMLALECPWDVWGSQSLTDLAVKADCEHLVNHESFERAVLARYTSGIKVNQTLFGFLPINYFFVVATAVMVPPIALLVQFEEEPTELKQEHKTSSSWFVRQLSRFYSTTVAKFLLYAELYILFMLLFTGVCLSEFEYHLSRGEWIVGFWVMGYFIEEVYQMVEDGFVSYAHSSWNRYDMAMQTMFFLYASFRGADSPYYAKLFLSTMATFTFVRMLQFMSVSKTMGPLIVSIGRMAYDISSFVCILLMFMLGFGVAIQGVLDTYVFNGADETTKLTSALQSVILRPYYGMMGEVFPEDLEQIDGFYTYILVAVYVIIANVLLLNLLIAVMASTYAKVEQSAQKEWLTLSYHLTQEYESKYLPAPISAVQRVFCLTRTLFGTPLEDEKDIRTRARRRIIPEYIEGESDDLFFSSTGDVEDFVMANFLEIRLTYSRSRIDKPTVVSGTSGKAAGEKAIVSFEDVNGKQDMKNKLGVGQAVPGVDLPSLVSVVSEMQHDLQIQIRNDMRLMSEIKDSDSASIDQITFLTDIEGNLDYFLRWARASKVVQLATDKFTGRLCLNLRPGTGFVFGGDVVDKGVGDIRISNLILGLKMRYPERVWLIGGNRDYNKMRFSSEIVDDEISKRLDERVPYWVSSKKRQSFRSWAESKKLKPSKVNYLKFLLSATMGAPDAFEHRRQELLVLRNKAAVPDAEVFDSFVSSVGSKGWLRSYLRHTQTAAIVGDVLFVHGGINETNFGTIPGESGRCMTVQEWVQRINLWTKDQISQWRKYPNWVRQQDWPERLTRSGREVEDNGRLIIRSTDPYRGGDDLIDYIVPSGCRGKTVVCADYWENDRPKRLSPQVVHWLQTSGIRFVISGHRPHGDTPMPLISDGIYTLTADTSYATGEDSPSRGDSLNEIIIAYHKKEAAVHVSGQDCAGRRFRYVLGGSGVEDGDPYVGRTTAAGQLVKAKLQGSSLAGDVDYLVSQTEGFSVVTDEIAGSELCNMLDPTQTWVEYPQDEDAGTPLSPLK